MSDKSVGIILLIFFCVSAIYLPYDLVRRLSRKLPLSRVTAKHAENIVFTFYVLGTLGSIFLAVYVGVGLL